MNKLLREFERQSGLDVYGLGAKRFPWEAALEKYAELIVRECLKIVEPDQTSGDEWCVTLDETAQSIRQHFGVEK
jgi:hypothetical protein